MENHRPILRLWQHFTLRGPVMTTWVAYQQRDVPRLDQCGQVRIDLPLYVKKYRRIFRPYFPNHYQKNLHRSFLFKLLDLLKIFDVVFWVLFIPLRIRLLAEGNEVIEIDAQEFADLLAEGRAIHIPLIGSQVRMQVKDGGQDGIEFYDNDYDYSYRIAWWTMPDEWMPISIWHRQCVEYLEECFTKELRKSRT